MDTDKTYAKKIALEYSLKQTSKALALKKLDQKAKLPANIFTYTFGIVMALIFGVGMCYSLNVIGEGYYQEQGKKARKLMPGDVVYIEPGVKHWHGASKDSWFSHLCIEVPGENTSNEWLEAVNDEEYNKLSHGDF